MLGVLGRERAGAKGRTRAGERLEPKHPRGQARCRALRLWPGVAETERELARQGREVGRRVAGHGVAVLDQDRPRNPIAGEPEPEPDQLDHRREPRREAGVLAQLRADLPEQRVIEPAIGLGEREHLRRGQEPIRLGDREAIEGRPNPLDRLALADPQRVDVLELFELIERLVFELVELVGQHRGHHGSSRQRGRACYLRPPMAGTPRLPPPRDVDEARERMARAGIPEPILAVLHTLDRAGHHGVVVGGAVRDALLGLDGVDWDVASDATPDEVIRLFPRTIPTGIEHGTVTVLSGRGDDRHAVELTTFRGEGAYHDGRRPSEVTFLRELVQDLARRDLTINAFAWDPVNQVFTDAFAGLADLEAGQIRAVGDPSTRFAEDGLRTMRAVRFAATMGFALHPETEAAIAGALDVFDRVSRERVRVELIKLLAAPRPSLGLLPMARTGLWSRVLVDIPEPERELAILAVDRMQPDPIVRLARLLWPSRHAPEPIAAVVEALRPSRDERATLLALTSPRLEQLAELALDADTSAGPLLRRIVASLGRPLLDAAIDLLALTPEHAARVHAEVDGAPLTGKELAIKGRDLISAGVAKPGPELGVRLDQLLEWVLDDPRRNELAALLARAAELGR